MATHKNPPFVIEKKEVVLVKPANPTPSEVLSFSSIDNDPNCEVISDSIYVYKANPTTVSPPSSNGNSDHHQPDPVGVIKEAISKVLIHYYPLAGKLKRHKDGRLYVTCNASGVPFLEATANCTLSSLNYLDGIDLDAAKEFVLDYTTKDEFGYHPVLFQVTRFSCGGFTLGLGLSHAFCDGFGAGQFYKAMAELASGMSEPSVKPVWERERLVGKLLPNDSESLPFDKASLATSPYLPTTDLVHEIFGVTCDTVNRLKSVLIKQCGDEDLKGGSTFTTLEALGAYVWRARFRAFKLNPDGKTMMFFPKGSRPILNPPLPKGYYGNCFVSSHAEMTGKELNEGPLSKAAKLIREAKIVASTPEFIWGEIRALEKQLEMNVKLEAGVGATMFLTDWRQLSVLGEGVDFGWKGTVNIVPLPCHMFGTVDLVTFYPPSCLDPSMRGGVRVLVSLPRDAMPLFREEMHALSHIDVAAFA